VGCGVQAEQSVHRRVGKDGSDEIVKIDARRSLPRIVAEKLPCPGTRAEFLTMRAVEPATA
jgi:hypothetical protein